MNIKKINRVIQKTIESNNYSTKIELYFSSKTAGTYYDPYEKNYTYSNLNPITIKGFVSDLSMESLVWNQMGLAETGSKVIICQEKYEDWFRNCTLIKIDGDSYQVYKDNVGSKFLITQLRCKLIKVIVTKVK
uniref:Uncharacterized protein n=1 Tax=viral metagenome TaxID=1070528 RepID=A0A6M3K4P8_9ZZZZ